MKTMGSVVLFCAAIFAAQVAILATMPLLPGYLEEGATPPTDTTEVYAAAERLWRAGGMLLLTLMIMHQAPAQLVAPLTWCACAALAFTLYRTFDVVRIIVMWAPHVRGERTAYYWAAITESFLVLVVGVLCLFLFVIRPLGL